VSVVVDFVIDSILKLLDTPSYIAIWTMLYYTRGTTYETQPWSRLSW